MENSKSTLNVHSGNVNSLTATPKFTISDASAPITLTILYGKISSKWFNQLLFLIVKYM
jgi:hypothetical protein